MKIKLTFLIAIYLILFTLANAQQNSTLPIEVQKGKQKSFTLQGNPPYVGYFTLNLKESEIPKNQERWYVFAMAQTSPDNVKFFGQPSKIEIKKGSSLNQSSLISQCNIIEASDACLIKNNDFDYKTDKLFFAVHCQKQCQFGFVAEADYSYPMELNKSIRLNFEKSAYSKIFSIDTSGNDFYELRILLKPKGFIKFGQPIILLANYGSEIPSREKHDFQGMHIWDDGQGIFLRKSEMKDRTLTILVQGPEQNVLGLIAQTIQKQERLNLEQFWPEFDLLNANEKRQFVGVVKQGRSYRFKVDIFSGFLESPQIFKIENNQTVPLKFPMPNQKYGEYEFKLTEQFIKKQNLNNVLLKVTAQKSTSYLVSFSRDDEEITELYPYISESSVMEPKEIHQYFIKVEQLIEAAKEKKISKIQIILGNLYGSISPKFYQCKIKNSGDSARECVYNSFSKQNFSQVFANTNEDNGGERRFWFDIDWADSQDKQSKVQIVYKMVVVLENTNDKQATYEIQYKNKDRIYLLKEGELVRDRAFIQQKRHYKLSISDFDAAEVRIHCTKISGQAKFSGAVVDPRQNKNFERILPVLGVVVIKLQQNRRLYEVFIEVEGIENCFYSLTTQVIRKSQGNPHKKNATGYNQLIVRENTFYEFLISPSDSIVLQLRVNSSIVKLNLKATSAVKVCMTQDLTNPPFSPNCQIQDDTFLQMNKRIIFEKGNVGNIGIKNPSDRNVTIRVQISGRNGQKGEQTKQECQGVQTNQIMFKRIDSKGVDMDGDSYHCLRFNINKIQEIQLIVDLNENYQYNTGTITASMNGKELIRVLSPSHIFEKEDVKASCGDIGGSDSLCYLEVKIEGIYDTRLRVLAQFTTDAMRLIDGVSHAVNSMIRKSEAKYFYLPIHNFDNITVFLQNINGLFKVYAKMIKYEIFENENKSKSLYPTPAENDLESSNPFYFIEQIITVPKQKIQQKCVYNDERQWINCVLLLSVYLDQSYSQDVSTNANFVIEASQHNRYLKEGLALTGFLQEKSVAFYNFKNQIEDATIFVNVNNQNKNCLNIYVKQGSLPASDQENDKHAKGANLVLYPNAKKGQFSITVQGIKNCPYSISYSASKNNLQKIKKGTFIDILLQPNQEKNLLFENLINESFKILSAHKTGEVLISVNPVKKDEIELVAKKDISKIQNWMFSMKDYVQIRNTSSNYCVDCFYLINVKALRKTDASLIIPTPDIQVPLEIDYLIKDVLSAKQKSVFRFFTDSKGQFEVYIQYGKLRITISESETNTVSFTRQFQQVNKPEIVQFNTTASKQYYYFRYSQITIEALMDTYYSFSIISNADPNLRGSKLKYGIPEYFFLQKNKQQCLEGIIGKVDVFLFSFGKGQRKNVENLNISLKVQNEEISFKKEIGANELVLSSSLARDQSLAYKLCLSAPEQLSITIIQSSPVNYLPQKTSILVQNELNITFGSEGQNIIEINQCHSRAITQIFSQFNKIKSTSSEIKQRRRSNNIVSFQHYGAVFISIRSLKSSVRWFAINQTSGEGQGYDDYQSGSVRIYSSNNTLLATAPHLASEKNPKSKLSYINYTFYAAKQQKELLNAMNCVDGQFVTKSIIFEPGKNSQALKDKVEVSFDIDKDLKPLFAKEDYFLIGMKAQAVVTLPSGLKEDYRFYYPYQQVSREMFNTYTPISPIIPNEGSSFEELLALIGYGLVSIMFVIGLFLIYKKFIKKRLSKKVGLNEEGGMEMKYSDFNTTN